LCSNVITNLAGRDCSKTKAGHTVLARRREANLPIVTFLQAARRVCKRHIVMLQQRNGSPAGVAGRSTVAKHTRSFFFDLQAPIRPLASLQHLLDRR
jgi:hypothetical protein